MKARELLKLQDDITRLAKGRFGPAVRLRRVSRGSLSVEEGAVLADSGVRVPGWSRGLSRVQRLQAMYSGRYVDMRLERERKKERKGKK